MFRVRPQVKPPGGASPILPPRPGELPLAPAASPIGANVTGKGSALLSTRSMVIISISLGIAVLSGLSAGVEAGITAKAAGPAWAISIGVLAGLATAAGVWVGAAASLNALVSRSD